MKKTLLCIGLVTILVGCTQFNVTPATSITHEYGEDLDKSMLFDKESSTEGVKVKDVDGFDALKVGTQEVSVVFTDAEEKKEFEAKVKVEVKDTKLPTIVLAKEKITVECGDKLNLKDLVKEVKDPVDGTLNYSDKKIDSNGWFFDKGDLDLKKAGTYEVKVISVDLNKNTSEEKITVTVKEKPVEKVEEPKVEKDTQQSTYQEPVAEKPTEQPIIENQHVCKATTLGNSGLLFSTEGEAAAYGQGLINQGTATSYTATSVFCECNTFVGYTVDYVYEVAQQPTETPKEEEKEDDEPKIIRELGNSGMVGTDEEMTEWANAQLLDSNSKWWKEGYRGWESWNVDQWGELWTVNFYKKNNK